MSTAAGGDAGTVVAGGAGGGGSGRGGSGTGGSSAGSGGNNAGTGGSNAGTGGNSAGTGGNNAGTGGNSAGTGGSSAGAGGSAGVCGACPPVAPIACLPSVTVRVSAAGGNLTGVTTTINQAAGYLNLRCYPTASDPCTWTCSAPPSLAPGDYSVTLSAPGYAPQTIEFSAEPLTNCGCCGCACAPAAYDGDVMLEPGGDGTPAACCADLMGNHDNCGACGNVCADGTTCQGGECVFSCFTQGQECSTGPCCSPLMCCSPMPGMPIGCYPGC